MSDSARYDRGVATQRLLDPDITEELEARFADVSPDFARLTVEIPFGDIYSRPGLDLRSRQIATVSALLALGAVNQLPTHMRFALNIGITREELVELVLQMGIYAGWPRAADGMRALRDACAEYERRRDDRDGESA